MENKELWTRALVDIELEVSPANFTTWFKNTKITRIEQGTAFIGTTNEFARDWLANKYNSTILRILRNISPEIRAIDFVIAKNITPNQAGRDLQLEKTEFTQKARANSMSMAGELPLAEAYVNKEDGLNPRYTFENFITGPFNELAFAASQAVLRKPGIMYNPLFIYGQTGIGKTHLTQALGNGIKKNFPGKRIQYISSERFANDYVSAVQSGKHAEFKERYRKHDVLIMDDIQFFAGKEKTQEELFHLYEALHGNNKQIIFSSDRHPNYINGLEDRLKSRFGAGMIVEITMPDYESRLAILQEKSHQQGVILSDEILRYVAETIQASIRELEGTLNLVICQAQLKQRELSVMDIKSLIKNNTKPTRPVSIKDIVRVISGFYNIDEKHIYEKTRRKEVVRPRQILMFILREDFNISYPLIGQKLGGRDHTTVIHSCEKVKNDVKTDGILLQEIEQIRALF
ncbi:MAG TPA: chromosomal replication initiator protein DnaA [Candidatus Paceibacterota bacterium]|nr:chromosomal replication initiator protein DnaA [Candidatus Paceibacterota bacterium]